MISALVDLQCVNALQCFIQYKLVDDSSEDEGAGNSNERDRTADDLFLDQSQMDAGVCYFLGLWRLL